MLIIFYLIDVLEEGEMPRIRRDVTVEKPGAMAAKARRTSLSEDGKMLVTQRRPRRSAYEVVEELKARREELAKVYQERLSKLDSRIERLEARHEKKIMVTQLLSTKTPEELALELAAIKKQQSLIKKALKAHR